MSKERKGLWDRIRGALGDGDAHERDLFDQGIRAAQAELAKMKRLAGQLEAAADEGQSPAWYDAVQALQGGIRQLEEDIQSDQNELDQMRSDRRPLAAKAGGAHNIYKGH